MKRNNTIMLSTILVIIMLFSLFCIAGCTVKNGTLNQDQTTTQEGKEPIKTEIVVLKYLTPEHPNWPITDDTPILKIIEEKTGVKINYIAVPSANYTEKFNMTMASGELPDLMHNSISVINEYANKKVFIPIDDLIKSQAPNLDRLFTPEVKIRLLNSDNKVYGVPSIYGDPTKTDAIISYAFLIRKDWLDKLSLKEPESLAEWENALREFKNGKFNNEKDIIPFIPQPTGSVNWIHHFEPAFGLNPDGWTAFGDELKYNIVLNEYKDIVTLLNKWYKDKLLDREYAVLSSKQWEERITSEISGATIAHTVRTDMFTNAMQTSNPEFNLVATVPPAGPEGKQAALGGSAIREGMSVGISKDCKNKEAAIKYLDYLYSDEGVLLMSWGVEDKTFAFKDGKKVFINNYDKDWVTQSTFGIMPNIFAYRIDSDADRAIGYGKNMNDAENKLQNYLVTLRPTLTLTPEEQENATNILSAINPIINQYIDKFIMGEIPLSDWEKFQEQLKSFKVEELEKIYSAAYKRQIEAYNTIKK